MPGRSAVTGTGRTFGQSPVWQRRTGKCGRETSDVVLFQKTRDAKSWASFPPASGTLSSLQQFQSKVYVARTMAILESGAKALTCLCSVDALSPALRPGHVDFVSQPVLGALEAMRDSLLKELESLDCQGCYQRWGSCSASTPRFPCAKCPAIRAQ